jgi:hypothetical protein
VALTYSIRAATSIWSRWIWRSICAGKRCWRWRDGNRNRVFAP